MELIPGLPEELGLECLTRVPYSAHRATSQVCQLWLELLDSQEFYHHRKQRGYTHKVACLVQSPLADEEEGRKPTDSLSYGITVFDPVSQTWERVDPVPQYPNGLPLFCQLAGCEGKLIVMGGWNPLSYDPVQDVFLYDFTTCQWRKGKEMPSKRSFFAIGAVGSRVYIAGGHDENKNALKSAWAYDVRRDEWTELTQMSREHDECEGVVIGNEFWVVSGYATESQGMFEENAESYQLETGEWRRVEGAWKARQCPKSCVGVGEDGKLVSLTELDSVVRVGVCGVRLGTRTLVTGSAYQGAPQRFILKGMNEGQNGKLEITGVPHEFNGFVQSGCCVEI